MERLSSWKEVAEYLGVTVRTAQKWEEERGLPIHRLPGPRGPVAAFTHEIDAWRARSPIPLEPDENPATSEHPAGTQPAISPGRKGTRIRLAAAAVALLMVAAVGAVLVARKAPNPVTVVVGRDGLAAMAADGSTIWQHAFPQLDPAFYSGFRKSRWVGDLNGDGRNEVLFVFKRTDTEYRNGDVLYCFDSKGKERWRFVPGHAVKTSSESFDAPFVINEFTVIPHGRGYHIIVASHHATYFPAQVTLLSERGEVLGEYWHSGFINSIEAADLDQDGRYEVYLGGVDNGLRAATLVILDPDQIRGASPEPDPHYQIQGMMLAQERARLLFPHSCITRLAPPYNSVWELRLTAKDVIVSVQEDVQEPNSTFMYDIGPDATVRSISPSDSFLTVHEQFRLAHRLNHAWSNAELQELRAVKNIAATKTVP